MADQLVLEQMPTKTGSNRPPAYFGLPRNNDAVAQYHRLQSRFTPLQPSTGVANTEPKERGSMMRTAFTSSPQYRNLAAKLCSEHPAISVDKNIFGGVPHIKNVRLAVGDVLAQLYMLGSVAAVVERFSPNISEEQVKEALAYAQDFIDMACDPHA